MLSPAPSSVPPPPPTLSLRSTPISIRSSPSCSTNLTHTVQTSPRDSSSISTPINGNIGNDGTVGRSPFLGLGGGAINRDINADGVNNGGVNNGGVNSTALNTALNGMENNLTVKSSSVQSSTMQSSTMQSSTIIRGNAADNTADSNAGGRHTTTPPSTPLLITLPPQTSPLLPQLLHLFRSFGQSQINLPPFPSNYALITYASPLGREKALCQDGVVFKDGAEGFFITVRKADWGTAEEIGVVRTEGGNGRLGPDNWNMGKGGEEGGIRLPEGGGVKFKRFSEVGKVIDVKGKEGGKGGVMKEKKYKGTWGRFWEFILD